MTYRQRSYAELDAAQDKTCLPDPPECDGDGIGWTHALVCNPLEGPHAFCTEWDCPGCSQCEPTDEETR